MMEYLELIDLPTTTPVLREIFDTNDYVVGGCGGDVVLAGAIEYQPLHADNIWGYLPLHDHPVPVVTINFIMQDLTSINGPVRQIRGTHRSDNPIPNLLEEPMWMKASSVCPIPAGSAIIRDNRAWHGGTPNLSNERRSL